MGRAGIPLYISLGGILIDLWRKKVTPMSILRSWTEKSVLFAAGGIYLILVLRAPHLIIEEKNKEMKTLQNQNTIMEQNFKSQISQKNRSNTTIDKDARKRKIREDLANFIPELWDLDMAYRGGWSLEEMQKRNLHDVGSRIMNYLRANFDESYVVLFRNPEVKNIGTSNSNERSYQGQGMSELTREQIHYLQKIIEENR